MNEPHRFLQILAGPRQAGKTTLARQLAGELAIQSHHATADEPTLQDRIGLTGTARWISFSLKIGACHRF